MAISLTQQMGALLLLGHGKPDRNKLKICCMIIPRSGSAQIRCQQSGTWRASKPEPVTAAADLRHAEPMIHSGLPHSLCCAASEADGGIQRLQRCHPGQALAGMQ